MSKISELNNNPKKTIKSQGFVSLLEDFHEPHQVNEGNQKKIENAPGGQASASDEPRFVSGGIIKAAERQMTREMEEVPETHREPSLPSRQTIDSLLEEFHYEAYEYLKDNHIEEPLESISEEAQEILKEAEQEAAKIIQEAEKAADKRMKQLITVAEEKTTRMIEEAEIKVQQIHQTARESGYNQGFTEGRQSAYEETRGQLSSLVQILTNLINETAATKKLIIKEMEEEILSLTLTIASKLAGIELSINRNAIVNIVKQGLQLLKDKNDITIKVSADEFALLKEYQPELLDFADGIENISVEKDAALTVGECQIYADSALVDNTFKQRLENAATAIWQSYHE